MHPFREQGNVGLRVNAEKFGAPDPRVALGRLLGNDQQRAPTAHIEIVLFIAVPFALLDAGRCGFCRLSDQHRAEGARKQCRLNGPKFGFVGGVHRNVSQTRK